MEKWDFPNRLENGFGAELSSPESLSYIETFLRRLVRDEAEKKVDSYLKLHQSSSSKLNDQTGEEPNLKLSFLNQIPSIIFTNNELEAENGEPLQIALRDTTNWMNNNIIVQPNPLSSALIEFVVLNAEFLSSHREEDEVHWNVGDFEKSILIEREGKSPLIVGDGRKVRLKNGVASIKHLSFTDNSSWRRSKQFRLGVRIIDEEILAKYPRIGEAISKPFRVMDHRGEVIKKHHPPKGEDEVWRLEGIGKDGKYHKRLSSKGIKNVCVFIKAYKRDPGSLRKLLGNKISNKTWKAMVDNALECVSTTTCTDPSFGKIFGGNEGMGGKAFNGNSEVGKPKVNYPINSHEFTPFLSGFQDYDFMFEDNPPSLSHGETSTSNSHNHEMEIKTQARATNTSKEVWTKLVPKP